VLDLNAAIDALEPMVRQLIGENMRLIVKLGHAAVTSAQTPVSSTRS